MSSHESQKGTLLKKPRATPSTVGRLGHGQVISSKALGDMSVVSKASALSSGFGYGVPVSTVTGSQALLLLLEEFYVVVEPLDSKSVCVLFPLKMAQVFLPEPVNSEIDHLELIRLLTSQLVHEFPIGVCLRGQDEQTERCVYQVLPKNVDLEVLEKTVHRIVDFALLITEWRQERQEKKPTRFLEQSVESHRF